jgi:hypothetical protein
LNESIGRRLVRALFEMLQPGGRLVVANYLPEIRDVGYMEAFMEWQLVYRHRTDMARLTADLPESRVRSVQIHSEENRNIIFLQVNKA